MDNCLGSPLPTSSSASCPGAPLVTPARVPVSRRGVFNPLRMSAHEKRSNNVTLKANMYLDGSRVIYKGDKVSYVTAHKRAKHSSSTIWHDLPTNIIQEDILAFRPLLEDMGTARRSAIEYMFIQIYNAPLENTWADTNLIAGISNALHIPPGSFNTVKACLKNIMAAREAAKPFCAKDCLRRRGRSLLIKDLSPKAHVLYLSLGSGLSLQQAAVHLNTYRIEHGQETLSWTAVRNFATASPIVIRHRTQTKKSGKEDAATVWAQARVAQFTQVQEQLRLGALEPLSDEVVASPFPPLQLHGIVWWDEKHKKVELGHTSKMESRIATLNGVPTLPANGGLFPPTMPNTTMKFPGEARGLFGAAMVKGGDGEMMGKKDLPFNYSGRIVVCIER
jgi:hypothetical protein